MATWEKEKVYIGPIRTYATGAKVTSGLTTVKLQPENQNYPTGAISCTIGSGDASVWFPDSDLEDDMNYRIYIDDVFYYTLAAKRQSPAIG